jgi:tetratricopeptide (TPR) repeat protein
MNPFTSILNLFKPTEPSESHKRWLEGSAAYERGEALLQARQNQEALVFLDTAISCGYDAYGRAYSMRGLCLQELDFQLDAIDDFTKAIAFEPENSNLYFMRSVSKGASGDFRGCAADLEEAIRVATLHRTANKSHDAGAKELGHKGNVVDLFKYHLAMAEVSIDEEALAVRMRAKSRRRTM